MLTGESLGRYRILEPLGKGGMGVVYRASDSELGREVAIKVLLETETTDQTGIERFEQEAQAVARLSHPNILEIFDFGRDGGVIFAVMELLQGETLRQRLKRSRLPIRKAMQIAEEVAEGLGAAHRAGVIHRDIKPENIFLTSKGPVKILDFGIAHLKTQPHQDPGPTAVTEKQADSGNPAGTLSYMSPEQVRGRKIEPSSDIFSLGCVLYEMIGGRRAFHGRSTVETVAAILEEDPAPLTGLRPGLPVTLDQIVSRCLEKQPEDRFESARDVAFALKATAEAARWSSQSHGHPPPRPWWKSRTAQAVAAAALVAAAVIGSVIVSRTEPAVVLPESMRIAVTTFAADAEDPDLVVFAAGLTEMAAEGAALLEEQTPGRFWVVPRNLMDGQQPTELEWIRRKYNVNLGITGELERLAHKINVRLNLVEPVSESTIRSRVVGTRVGNVSSFQEAITLNIAEMLGVDLSDAIRDLIAERNTNVTSAFAAYARARGQLGRLDDHGDLEAAIELFQKAVTEDPLYGPAFEGLAEAYLKKYRRDNDPQWVELARNAVHAALSVRPSVSAYRVAAELHSAAGEHERTIKALEAAARLAPLSGAVQSALGNAYQRAQQFDDARHAFQRAINRRPGFAYDHHALGFLYYQVGEYDAAANEFREVVQSAPLNPSGYNGLGGALYLLGRLDEAREMFEASTEVEPVDNYPAFSNLGTLYYDEARFSDAVDMYLRALEQEDGDYQVWGNLGFAYAYGSNPDQANRAFERAIALCTDASRENPGDPRVVSNLASYHAMIGNESAAREMQAAAVALAPDDPYDLLTIAETFEVLGERVQALEWIEHALAAGLEAGEVEINPTLRGLVADQRYQQMSITRGEIMTPGKAELDARS